MRMDLPRHTTTFYGHAKHGRDGHKHECGSYPYPHYWFNACWWQYGMLPKLHWKLLFFTWNRENPSCSDTIHRLCAEWRGIKSVFGVSRVGIHRTGGTAKTHSFSLRGIPSAVHDSKWIRILLGQTSNHGNTSSFLFLCSASVGQNNT